MNHGARLLTAREFDMDELLVLCLTPGIPFEWVVNAGRLGSVRKSELKRLMAAATSEDYQRAGANAASITEDDAWLMLKVIPTDYQGAIPLPAQLWLRSSTMTDAEIAAQLGVRSRRIQRWRTKQVFDPLTGARLIAPIGAPR